MKADDLDTVTDPSKLSADKFANGTHLTTAGWTRRSEPVAKSVTINGLKCINAIAPADWIKEIHYKSIDFTLDKNQIVKGNRILLAAFQEIPEVGKQSLDNNKAPEISWWNTAQNHDILYRGQKIGHVEFSSDYSEADIYIVIDKTSKVASDPSFTYTNGEDGHINTNVEWSNDWANAANYFNRKNHLSYPLKYAIIGPNNYLQNIEYTNKPEDTFTSQPLGLGTDYYRDGYNQFYGKSFWGYPNSYDFALHTTDKLFNINFIKNESIWARKYMNVFNKNGEHTPDFSVLYVADDSIGKWEEKDNDLTVHDLWNLTPEGHFTFSRQSDGSVIWVLKPTKEQLKIDRNTYKKDLDKSYLLNVQDPDHADDYMNASLSQLDKYNDLPTYVNILFGLNDQAYNKKTPNIITATEVTPNNINTVFTDKRMVMDSNPINGATANLEFYRSTLVYYFDSKTNNNITNDSIMGTKNNSTDYKLNIPKGYVLDTKSGKNVDGKQYKWSTDKKSIAYTFNEDQKVNDANPINIYITHGTHNTNDNSGKSTRTIQYTGLPDNLKPKDNVQTILFKRSGVTDDVSGETTYGDWQPQSGNGHYTAVTSPTFAGYKPDQEVIPDTAATPNKNETVTVNYSRTNQNAKLTVHDDTANTDLNDYAENSTGLYQDQINFKTAPSAVEQELKDKGYNIVSDSFKGSPTYNADDSKNNFVIHVTHKIVPVTPDQPKTPTDVIPDTKQHYPTGVDTNDLNKDVQRSIFYKYEDNTQAEPTVVQKAHFSRTVKVDAVTQKIVDNGTWATKDNYPEVATKSIDGYTPDKTKVDSATPSMINNQDQTVIYHANDEDAAITYIDDTTGKVLKTDTQKAKYKQTIKFATDPNTQIQTYKDQGYVLVSSDWKDGSTYQTDPARNKFTVHIKHGTSTVTPDKPKKPTDIIPGTKQHYPTGVDTNDLNQPQQRQITYTYADSKKQASPTVTQKVTFYRTATVDNVTGKTTYTDWTTSDQYPEVKSPTIEGYTPDRQTVPAIKSVLNTKQDVAVIYNPNPEQVDVIAQDNTGKQLSKSTLHGNYNTNYSATTPVIKGYHLIKMPTNTHGTYKIHNDPIIYIYAPDSNSVPEQTDGTPKPDKSSYPNDLTPAKRSNKLPETGNINLSSELRSVTNNITHTLSHLLH